VESVHRTHLAERELLAQGLSVDELGGDELHTGGFTDFVNGEDIGMVEGGGGKRFLLKAAQAVAIIDRIGRKGLDGDLAAETGVLREVDSPHTAGAQQGDDLVAGDTVAGLE